MRKRACYAIIVLGLLGWSPLLLAGGGQHAGAKAELPDFGPLPGLPQWNRDAFR